MISSEFEYTKAQEELEYLRAWATHLVNDTSTERAGFTLLSVRSMISRVSKEITDYEASKPVTEDAESITEEDAGS